MRTWLEWLYTRVFTYTQFITYVRDTNISIRQRQDYFYQYVHLFRDELQTNKNDLHYVSTMLCE